jgi:hypothetical protein
LTKLYTKEKARLSEFEFDNLKLKQLIKQNEQRKRRGAET